MDIKDCTDETVNGGREAQLVCRRALELARCELEMNVASRANAGLEKSNICSLSINGILYRPIRVNRFIA